MVAKNMGVRRGGQEGALDRPPWPTKIVCFLHFFDENSIFLGVFWANSMFLPPWKILPSPGKKSADAHGEKNYVGATRWCNWTLEIKI
jgi:hypothetical protein